VSLLPGVLAGNILVITEPNGSVTSSNRAHTHHALLLAPSCSDSLTRLPTPAQTIINFPLSLPLFPTLTSPHLVLPHHPSSFVSLFSIQKSLKTLRTFSIYLFFDELFIKCRRPKKIYLVVTFYTFYQIFVAVIFD
jgi:hypothetical protein